MEAVGCFYLNCIYIVGMGRWRHRSCGPLRIRGQFRFKQYLCVCDRPHFRRADRSEGLAVCHRYSAHSLTVTPNGQFAYTSNNGSNDISAYTVDAVGGGLTPVSGAPFSTGTTRFSVVSPPNSPLVVDPSGTFAFVTVPSAVSGPPPFGIQSPDFAAFTIDAASGTLNPVSGSPFGTFGTQPGQGSSFPELPTIDSSGHYIYSINEEGAIGDESISVAVFSLDASAATVTALAGSPFPNNTFRSGSVRSFTLTPSGKFAYLTDSTRDGLRCLSTDSTSPAFMTGCGTTLFTSNSPGSGIVRFNQAGQILYASADGQVNYFTIDSATGTLTPISGSPAAMPYLAVAAASLDPTGQFLYVAGQAASVPNSGAPSGNLIYAYALDPTTGALSPVAGSPFSFADAPAAMDIESSGKFLYVSSASANRIYAFSIDPTSGALTAVTGSPFVTGTTPGTPVFIY
jgi:6-phosphogluconolactonase